MYKYAQLNDKNEVVGISYLSGEVTADNMILINDRDIALGSIYQRENDFFQIVEKVVDAVEEPQISAEEKLLLEMEYHTILLETLTGGL